MFEWCLYYVVVLWLDCCVCVIFISILFWVLALAMVFILFFSYLTLFYFFYYFSTFLRGVFFGLFCTHNFNRLGCQLYLLEEICIIFSVYAWADLVSHENFNNSNTPSNNKKEIKAQQQQYWNSYISFSNYIFIKSTTRFSY